MATQAFWRVTRLLRLKWTALAATLLFFNFLPSATAMAQLSGSDRIVTLKNGAQFEGETFGVPSVGGYEPHPLGVKRITAIKDGLRRIFVANIRIDNLGDSNLDNSSIPIWQRVYPGETEGFGHISSIGPFDENGHRILTVQFRDAGGVKTVNYVQGITEITPRYVEVQTLLIPSSIPGDDRKMREWTMKIGVNNVPVDVLRSVLRSQIKNYKSPSEHLQIAEFFLKAQRYPQALAELASIQRQFPDLREEIGERRKSVRQSYARFILREVRLRMESGQYNYAALLASKFRKDNLAGEILAEFSDVQSQISNLQRRVEQARAVVKKLAEEINASGSFDEKQMEVVRRFQNELETELNPTNLPRLDSFIRLANDATMKMDRKIALAISGWLMGGNNAIDNLAVVQSMFPVRDLAVDYLQSKDKNQREAYLKVMEGYEAGAPEFLSKIIASMKPPLAPDLAEYNGSKPIEFSVEVPGTEKDGKPRKFKCLAHLPPQYDPYRRYPCIMTLRAGTTTESQLNRWCGPFNEKLQVRAGRAARHGYIVVSVDWKQEGQSVYTYSLREHAIVLKALRQSLRMFAIDSDRVFLHGHDIGANAAYDIGLSHPEHWAGVIGVGGAIDRYPNNYSKNEHVSLPIYSVIGEKDKANRDRSRRAWNEWCVTQRYVDCVVVMYVGRANVSYGAGPTEERFAEEEPEMFKWMFAQRRRRPDRSGFQFECKVLRPWDNYFWFWKLHDIPEDNVTRPEHWRFNGHNPLTISGELKSNVPNRFILGPSNLGSGGTLSLSPEFFDFDEKIQITGRGEYKGYVQPSSKTLLEDVRKRGDRQHPYWAQLECRGKRWSIIE